MALGAVLATALTTHATRAKGLFLGGVDVLGNTPIETVTVHEEGAGGVSSMTFTVEDVAKAVTIANGMEVMFQNFTSDRTLFRGWVQHFDVTEMPGGLGRMIRVECVGAEALLDWAVLSAPVALGVGGSTARIPEAVQTLVANSIGTGPLRAFVAAAGTASSPEFPIFGYTGGGLSGASGVTVTAGTSLREAIRQVTDLDSATNTLVMTTVDFNFGLRVASVLPTIAIVRTTDYTDGTVNDDPPWTAGVPVAEPLMYGVDASTTVGVYVQGTGAAAVVYDGSGNVGPLAYLLNTTLTSVAQCQAVGRTYLSQYTANVRGSVTFTDFSPTTVGYTNMHPTFSVVTITDSRVLPASGMVFMVGTIDKTFNGSGRENWQVSVGAKAPSAVQLIRQFTYTARA